ncbi:MAG: ankyrin repeat domain-containing protein, partial [Acidobacteria bacterium]|nr:ankyrin repeat domain-containing protein [Acidobacteriota bacterium]
MKCRGNGPRWIARMLIGTLGGFTGIAAIPVAASGEEIGNSCTHWNTHKFFESASLEDVTTCLQNGADPKARDVDGRTPLHHLARANANPSLVAVLVRAGADPNARAARGWTPLHGAALSAAG